MFCTSLVDLLCTFSMETLSFLYMTDQTVDAYSKLGLTMLLYRFKNIFLSR